MTTTDGTKELTVYQPMTVTELRNLATDFAKSGYFQDAREMVQAVVKIQAGRELGFGPVYSMTKIYIVKGKVAVSAETMGAMIKRSGRYDYKVEKLDNDEAVIQFFDGGKPDYKSKFTMEDAKRAQLIKDDSNWQKWPRAMLMSKALSQGARIVCPHVISGTYTPEDFGLEPNAEGDYQEPKIEVAQPLDKLIETAGGIEMANDKLRKQLFARAGDKGYSFDKIKDILTRHYKHEHTEDLTKTEADEFIAKINQGAQINEQGEWL